MKIICILIVLMTSSLQYGFSQTVNPIDTTKILKDLTAISTNSEWEEVKNTDGIVIHYRNISMEELFSTREIRVKFKLKTNLKNFISYIQNDTKHGLWNKGMKSIKSYDKTDSTWISKLIYDIPFPLNKQDLIVMNTISNQDSMTLVHVHSIPDYLPENKNMDRIKHYLGTWEIKEMSDGNLDITYSAVTISKSFIPKFLKDPLIQNNLIKSFRNLCSAVENDASL